METKRRSNKMVKAFIGKTEKVCIKCGFATFCLHVLYKHKYRCQGKLLGQPYVCRFCKKKFHFLLMFRTHKRLCHKRLSKRYKYKSNLPNNKVKVEHTNLNSVHSIQAHLSHQTKTKGFHNKEHSARKTINNAKRSSRKSLPFPRAKDNLKSPDFNIYLDNSIETGFSCLWCKSSYPSRKLLLMHLERNKKCFIVHYQKDLSHKTNTSFTARKTVVAKKSFPNKKKSAVNISSNRISDMSSNRISNMSSNRMSNMSSNRMSNMSSNRMSNMSSNRMSNMSSNKMSNISGSARKTTGRSSKKKIYDHKKSFVSHCPVCYKKFFDNFAFFQHQKVLNHWGRATKSVGTYCKCPFCKKEFFHVKARDVHVQNHSDKTEEEIKTYLDSVNCNMCSKSFVSYSTKQQHMNIQHKRGVSSSISSDINTISDSEYSSKNKLSTVPSSVKKKLKKQPNTCPVCGKGFSHTVLRNKHFNEIHLKIFECQFCNTKFKSTSSLSNHIQLIHCLECKDCKISFKDEFRLLQHALVSHPNKDPQSFLLSKPIKKVPSKEKLQDVTEGSFMAVGNEKLYFTDTTSQRNMEFFCDVCNIGYLKLCGLQRHRQSKLHKDTLMRNLDKVHESLSDLPPSPVPYPKATKQPEIITCSECSEDFTNIKEFVPHRLSHFSIQGKYLKISELNPYMCEICSDVLDSHSKVQLHLFWHLQIESTANNKTDTVKITNKSETIVPDRLSGQHVAKKSFSRPKSETQQEVVIGGVKKPLFTCEYCNIGFTTKLHLNMHMRKLCKKKKMDKEFSKGRNTAEESSTYVNDCISHCTDCNCLYSSTRLEQHKEFCFKYEYDSNSEDNLSNFDVISTAILFKMAVAGCVSCGILFDDIMSISNHLNIHKKSEETNLNDDVVHCAICNCLFSYHAFKLHKEFCNAAVNSGPYISDSKYMNVLKSALELKSAVAGCISCGLTFDDLQDFSEHLTLHQVKQIQNKDINVSQTNSFVKDMSGELDSCLGAKENEQLDVAKDQSLGASNLGSLRSLKTNSVDRPLKETGNAEDLRKNFSQLLCLLISDPELMERLGYGKQSVDKVLVNILQQMGQEPFINDSTSDIECFEKNIQTLLDFCLKDQIMQIIGNGKSTSEMVSEALKILSADESVKD